MRFALILTFSQEEKEQRVIVTPRFGSYAIQRPGMDTRNVRAS